MSVIDGNIDTAPLPRLATRLLSIIPRSATLKNQLLALQNFKQSGRLPLKKMGQLVFLNNVSTTSHVFPISPSDEVDSMPSMDDFLEGTNNSSFDSTFKVDPLIKDTAEESCNAEGATFEFHSILTRETANPELLNLGALAEELAYLESLAVEKLNRLDSSDLSF